MPNRGRMVRTKNKKNGNGGGNNEIASTELSADDLAIIGAGLAVLGDLFAFLSLIKVQQEEKGTENGKG
ncbi:hypothetical protein DFP94_102545 [Fontibacillus phaseoli]|uniref:Uncharacterized protein n=1 Tax=Fontibacillus phaseoli TaxID=1416533 RepID=A0A369BMG0_9BACL|nr:hypothetical protein [Fontibacillus phaseoli]RCX21786.1 hypothetical protein DFP94_102545 [Fontibacillus phaseoli]